MSDPYLNSEIRNTAQAIGIATSLDELQSSQLSFWLSVQVTMRQSGYEAVRKRFSFISQPLAESISTANIRSLTRLCSCHISTLRPSLPESTLMAMLEPSQQICAQAMLQVLTDERGSDDEECRRV